MSTAVSISLYNPSRLSESTCLPSLWDLAVDLSRFSFPFSRSVTLPNGGLRPSPASFQVQVLLEPSAWSGEALVVCFLFFGIFHIFHIFRCGLAC
jgi:hypothetical protein